MPIVKVNSESRMRKVSVTVYALAMIVFCASVVFSQVKSPPPQPSPTPPLRPIDGTFKNPDDTPLTTFEEEIRAKREIKIAEKEHQENLNRAKEISEIGKQLKELGELPVSAEGYDPAEWILLDYGDFLVHILSTAARSYYDLERLWRHAKAVDLESLR